MSRALIFHLIELDWCVTRKFFIGFSQMLIIMVAAVQGNCKPIFVRVEILHAKGIVKTDNFQKLLWRDTYPLFKLPVELFMRKASCLDKLI